MSAIARLSGWWKNLSKRGQTGRALDLMVLQTLDTLGPLHGYSIAARLKQFSGDALRVDLGTLYPVLRRLEQRGLLRARWDLTDTNRKARFYTITPAGGHQLAAEKAEWERTSSIVHTLLREHDKQKRELEIAREVQQRLFPQDDSPVSGLEYAGACRPAFEVGGDYYDFIRFSETDLGFAIGDVSGKGISAALLMATLRAYLRGQTALGEADLCRLMSNLNRFVHDSSATERYATFFYGRYDSSNRELHYVNAGHHPPLLFSDADGTARVFRLETGGPVIGLLPDCSYDQGTVRLAAGDVLVAFTDGISEAKNAADLEWGEERLTAAIQSSGAPAPRELIRQIMAEADAHAAEAPQHDDMTLIILRVSHGGIIEAGDRLADRPRQGEP